MFKKNYTYRVMINGQKVQGLVTHRKRLFLTQLRTINWRELRKTGGSAYIRVYYGRFRDVFNKLSDFYNDGIYQKRNDFWAAFRAFDELTERDF